MVYLIGASSLHLAVTKANYTVKRRLYNRSFSIPGLSFANKSPLKNLARLLSQGRLRKLPQKAVIWHDAISNSVSPHKSNNFCPLKPKQLAKTISKYKKQIAAILYVRRSGSVEIFNELKKSNVLVIDVRRHLLSKQKQQNPDILKNLKQLHPTTRRELNFAETIFRHANDLSVIVNKKQKYRKKKKSQRSRQRAKARSAQVKSSQL